jgi:Ser/Thr protein kinase RdoA (MazF antagonist)
MTASVARPRPVPLGKIDRCWVPLDDLDVARFFARSLFVPHNVRERFCWAAAGLVGSASTRLHRLASLTAILHAAPPEDGGEPAVVGNGAPRAELRRLAEEAAVLYALLDDLRDAMPAGERATPHWLLIEDYGRGERLVSALFSGGGEPQAILKIRPSDDPAPLSGELATLERLRGSLPEGLAATIPAPLAFRERGRYQALLLTSLPGRSAYVEMWGAWRPRPLATTHCTAAGEWLALFHGATRVAAPGASPLIHELGAAVADILAGGDGAWLDRLGRLDHAPASPATSVHGDFWARNLILPADRSELPGVVDWEAAAPSGPCTQDLFHFALTYALNVPGSGWRRLAPRPAFRRAFLEENALSRALGAYLRTYCRRLELDPAHLRDWFATYLLERAAAAAALPGAQPASLEPWLGFLEEIAWADRSVFSG